MGTKIELIDDVFVKSEDGQRTVPPTTEEVPELVQLRHAIDAPSRAEVRQLVIDELIKNNTLNRIEIKLGDKPPRELSDKPRHKLFPEILTAVEADLPVALIGPAGAGKSTVGLQISEALDLKFYLQNGVTGTHELAGYMDAQGRYVTTTFRTAFEFGGLMMVDEADTSDPGAFKWVNTAIAQGYAMFPDQPDPVYRHKDFRIIMGANTYGTGADRIYVGANQLDASTLDRFVFFDFEYDERMEMILAGNQKWVTRVQRIRRGAMKEKARVVISPRASINGARLLDRGWSQSKVEERVIWKGMDPELKERILKQAA